MKNSNKKGFTLVELVVVIAIIGVLAAILVPSMMGYVKKSRLKTANGNAKTAYNAVAEYLADQETQGKLAGASDADAKTSAENELKTNGSGAGEVFVGFQGDPVDFGKEGSDAFFFTQWGRSSADEIVGQYPDPAQKVEKVPTWGTFKSAED